MRRVLLSLMFGVFLVCCGGDDSGELASEGGAAAANCDQRADPTFTGPDCDECADPKFTGPDCDECSDPTYTGPDCDCDSVSEDALCDAVDSTRCAPEQAGLVQVCTDMGGCSVWSDGESCLEENLCTNAPDVCLDGACVADGDPNAECAGSDDPCMDVACDPATGICTTELKEENSSCDECADPA